MQAGAAKTLSSPDKGNRGNNRSYRVIASCLFTSHRCSRNASLERGNESYLGGAEASCQVPSRPSFSLAIHQVAKLVSRYLMCSRDNLPQKLSSTPCSVRYCFVLYCVFNRFIPGISTNAVNYHAYLLDG